METQTRCGLALRYAVGLAALVGTGHVMAQANSAASGVTMYGVLDACFVHHDKGNSSSKEISGAGCVLGSRLGFRGVEDFGGLRAHFILEQGFNVDTGTLAQGGRVFGRQSLVGLTGSLGTIEAGRALAPAFYVLVKVDPMALGIGSASSVMWSGAPSNQVSRTDNSINYVSSDWNGFSVRAQYGFGEQAPPASSRAGSTKGLSVIYDKNGVLLGASYADSMNAAGTGSDRATTLGAKVDFGAFSLAALAQSGGWEGTRTVAAPASATAFFSRRYSSYMVGGTLKLGNDTLAISHKRYNDKTASNFDTTDWTVMYTHPLSKRTRLYGGVSQLKNANASSYGAANAGGAYAGTTSGGTSRLINVGMIHTF